MGSTGDEFKTRYYGHTASFKDEKKRDATKLATHIWSLKDAAKRKKDNNELTNENEEKQSEEEEKEQNEGSLPAKYQVDWSIKWAAKSYKPSVRGICSLCNMERISIATTNGKLLNKRSELTSMCPHHKKLYFRDYKRKGRIKVVRQPAMKRKQ